MDIWRQVKTVLWSFAGLSGRKRGEDHRINPLVVILVAFLVVIAFLGAIAFIARSVVAAG